MIIWRGMGILALIVAVLINVLINEGSNSFFGIPEGYKHYRDAHKWMWLVGMGLSGIACWYLGRWIEVHELNKAKLLIDPTTGQGVRIISRHDLFWIPVKWWAVVWLVVGMALVFA